PKQAFLALTSMDKNNPRFVGGFRFRGSQEEAERIISRWRSGFLGQSPAAKREKLQYQRHEIELVAAAPFTLATTYDRTWFFSACRSWSTKLRLLGLPSRSVRKRHSFIYRCFSIWGRKSTH